MKRPYRALSSISVEITTTTGGAHQKVPSSPLAAIVTASSAPLKPMSPVARPSRLASSATCAKIWVPASARATSAMTLLSLPAGDLPGVIPDASKVPDARPQLRRDVENQGVSRWPLPEGDEPHPPLPRTPRLTAPDAMAHRSARLYPSLT